MARKLKEFAFYKGDEFLFIGTQKECAERLKINEESVRFYATPSYMRRLERRGAVNALIAVDISDYKEVNQ